MADEKAQTKADEKAPTKAAPAFDFAGVANGGPWAAYGSFGDVEEVSFNGRLVQPTSWRNRVVKGMVPSDVGPGPVEVKIGKRVALSVLT